MISLDFYADPFTCPHLRSHNRILALEAAAFTSRAMGWRVERGSHRPTPQCELRHYPWCQV